jgi:hypothetical protein
MFTLPRHRRTDLPICHVFMGSVSFAARSYFRPLDIGVIVFNVRATVDLPSNILPCRVIPGVVCYGS